MNLEGERTMHPGGERLIASLRWRALALSAASFGAAWAILVIVHRLCS
jgi:hypothetical protein